MMQIPSEFRRLVREGGHTGPTAGICPGYAQANLVILPRELAYDFLLFAQRNPKSCPILEVSDTGSRYLKEIAPGADIARDIPRYRIYEHGVMTGEYTDVSDFWRDDLVSFLIGCSFSFEGEADGAVCEHFMTVLPTVLEVDCAILDGRYRLKAEGCDFHLEKLMFEDAKLSSNWKTDGVFRIEITPKESRRVKIVFEKI